jgi:hypothetical protein
LGLDRERVDRTADFVSEDVVDQLVLLDSAEALETIRYDLGAKVIAAARGVLHADVGARQSLLYALT